MLAKMSSSGLTRWIAYAYVEPFGEGRADLRMGILASTIANLLGNRQKRPQGWEARDFMPDFDFAKRAQTLGQRIRAAFSAFARKPKEPKP